MPLYDFHCDACDSLFEADAAPGATPSCPACGSDEVRRVWTAPAVLGGPWMRGQAARASNAKRATREEQRQERKAARKEARKAQE
jgi:putative FmdB family regulatory protein